jgi:hypothetical protein
MQSDLLIFAIWLIIMAVLSHYRSSPIFPFNNVDDSGLWWDCFDRCVFEHLENTLAGIGLLRAAALASSLASQCLFHSMYSTVNSLK